MENEQKHSGTIVSITGKSNEHLHLLTNLYFEPFDPESVLSVVATLFYRERYEMNVIYSTETWCTSMDQSKSGTLFGVSMEGEIHIFREDKWNVTNAGCPDGLNSVWAAGDNEAFAIGLKGERVRILGKKVTVVRDPKGRRLNAVHGTLFSNVFAVGDGGVVFCFNGAVWKELERPTNNNLLTVLCRSDTEVYAAGANGMLFQWNGVGWKQLGSPEITITSIAFYQDRLYAAAGRDGIYVLGEKGLEPFKDLLVYRLKTIDTLLFGVGNRLVARFDGKVWRGGDIDL